MIWDSLCETKAQTASFRPDLTESKREKEKERASEIIILPAKFYFVVFACEGTGAKRKLKLARDMYGNDVTISFVDLR